MVVVVVEEEVCVFSPQREESALEVEERSRKKCYSIACSSYYGPSRATPEIIYPPPPLSLQRSISHSDILILRMPLLLTATEVNYRKPCKVYKSVHPSFPCARASKNANGIAGRIQTYSYWKQPQLYIHEPQTLYYRYTRSCFRCTNLA